MIHSELLDAAPFHSLGLVGTDTLVGDLGVEASVESEVTHPRHPPLGLDEVADITLHDDGSRECLPWPVEESLVLVPQQVVQWVSGDGATPRGPSRWARTYQSCLAP